MKLKQTYVRARLDRTAGEGESLLSRSLLRLSIGRRIFLAFGSTTTIAMVLLVLLSAFYYQAITQRNQAVKTAFAAQHSANDQAINLGRMNALTRTRLAQVFATSGGTLRDPSLAASGALIATDIVSREISFEQALSSYEQHYALSSAQDMRDVRAIVVSDDPSSGIGAEQQAALSLVQSREWPTYRRLQDRVLALLDPVSNPRLRSNPRQAYEQTYALLFDANALFLSLTLDWQRVVDVSQTLGQIVTNVGPSQTQPIVIATALALLATLLLISLIATLVNVTITLPLRQLSALTRRIAEGETTARARVVGQDEIALVADSMNSMLDQIVRLLTEAQHRSAHLNQQIVQLVHEVSGVGQGDLRRQADTHLPDLGELANSFNLMIEALSGLVIRVQVVAKRVRQAMGQTSWVMSQQVESTERQIAEMRAASGEMKRMEQASGQVTQQAQALSQVAQQARETTARGASLVEGTVAGLEHINAYVGSTASRVQLLGERSAAIGDIGGYMASLVTQTKRLSLDASIQARRAGESGKGFAEIADAIRRLSEEANGQTSKIAGLLRTVQSDIAEVQRAMSRTRQESEHGARQAQQTGEALASVFAIVEQQAEAMAAMLLVAQEQGQSSQAVIAAMQRVEQVSQQSSAATQAVVQHIKEHDELLVLLHTSVAVFKLRERRNAATAVGAVSAVGARPEQKPGARGVVSVRAGARRNTSSQGHAPSS